MEPRELNQALIDYGIERVCHEAIRGEWKMEAGGKEYCIGDIYGAAGNSLKVHLRNDKPGVWKDFSGSDKGGDLLDLWRLGRSLSMAETIKEVKAFLRITEPEFYRKFHEKPFKRPDASKLKILTQKSPVVEYLTMQRKLSAEAIKAFKVAQVEPVNGRGWALSFPFYNPAGELVNVKYLALERDENGKKKTWQEANAEPALFGWQAINPDVRWCVITEGEIDAITLHQYGYPALSVPEGAGPGAKQSWIETSWEWLQRFDDIYLCFDQETDAAKSAMVKTTRDEVAQRLGKHRCFNLFLPKGIKDPNEALQNGITIEEIQKCFEAAQPIKPEQIKFAGEFYDQIYQRMYEPDTTGVQIPWGLTPNKGRIPQRIRFRTGEVTIITGQSGGGKSAVLRNILIDIGQHGEKICKASFEEPPEEYYRRMVCILAGAKRPPVEHLNRAMEWLDDHVICTNVIGEMKLGVLLEIFRYAFRRYGARWFVIDSLMCLDDVPEEDLEAQKKAVQMICSFAIELKCHVFLVAHPNKAAGVDKPIGTLGVSGSAKITQRVDNVISMWRNEKKELNDDPDENDPDAILMVGKNRRDGFLARYQLWYDPESLQYLEQDEKSKPKIPMPFIPKEKYVDPARLAPVDDWQFQGQWEDDN